MARPARAPKFFENVSPEPNSGCWLWTAAINANGYGVGWAGKGTILAHRASWQLHKGSIPSDLRVLHKCDVRCCVNPDHLFLGTPQDNTDDMMRKRRSKTARLTERDVYEIRSSREASPVLAARYGVSPSAIRHTKTFRHWKHIALEAH